jgi:hypothetical protein
MKVTRFKADSVLVKGRDVELRLGVSSSGGIVGGRHVGFGWLAEKKADK